MAKKRKWSDQQLIEAVLISKSYYDVLRKLDLKLSGGSHATVKLRVGQLGLDTSHFLGQGWCNGEKHREFTNKFVKIPTEEILKKESTYSSTYRLKNRLIKEGLLENKCYVCRANPIWQNKPLSLQLDHKDGDRCNNEIENLRILCPNCHSQTETFAGKKKKN